MKRLNRVLAAGAAGGLLTLSLVSVASPAAATVTTYSTPGFASYSIPAGVENLRMDVVGGGGSGGASASGAGTGGNGGSSVGVTAYVDVSDRASLNVGVGTHNQYSAIIEGSVSPLITVVAAGGGSGGDGGVTGAGGSGGSASGPDVNNGSGGVGGAGTGAVGAQGLGGLGGTSAGAGAGGQGGLPGGFNGDPGASGIGGNGGSGATGGGSGGAGGGGIEAGGGGGGGGYDGGGGGGAGWTATTGVVGVSSFDPVALGAGGGGNGAASGAGAGQAGDDGLVVITAMNQAVVSTTPGDGSATVSWTTPTQPETATYVLYQDDVEVPGATNGGTITGLTNGTPYTYTVRAVSDAGLDTEMSTVSEPATVTPAAATAPAAPKIPRLTFDSAKQVTVSVTESAAGATLQTRTKPRGGSWTDWTQTSGTSTSLAVNVRKGAWIQARAQDANGTSDPVTTFTRITGNPAIRGDAAGCRATPVVGVSYPATRKAKVTLGTARKCASYRTSLDNGKTYGKWKRVKAKTLTAPRLAEATKARVQVKAGQRRTTVWLYQPN